MFYVKCLINFIGLNDMTNFLDKLAMNVGSWTAAGFYKAGVKNEDYELLNDCQMEKDWEQRRKELINEPCDNDAPEWANWKAQDGTGRWYWYDKKPTDDEDGIYGIWFNDDGYYVSGSNNGKIPAGHDWRDTLREVERGTDISDHVHKHGETSKGFTSPDDAQECGDTLRKVEQDPKVYQKFIGLFKATESTRLGDMQKIIWPDKDIMAGLLKPRNETLPAIQELVYIIDSCECDTAKSILYNKLEELLGRL